MGKEGDSDYEVLKKAFIHHPTCHLWGHLIMSNKILGYFSYKKVSKMKAKLRVAFLTWSVEWKRVLTIENYQKRGRILVNRCFLCHGHNKNTKSSSLCSKVEGVGIQFGTSLTLTMLSSRMTYEHGKRSQLWSVERNFYVIPSTIFWIT